MNAGKTFAKREEEIKTVWGDNTTQAEKQIALEWFAEWAWSEFENVNSPLRGFSFKCSQSGTLLTVRWTKDGVGVVSFVSAVTSGDCIRIAYRKWRSDLMNETADKYA